MSAATPPAVRSRNRWIGPLCAVVGVFGFSFKAILIKLAYKAYPVDAVTLLTFRMLYSAPLFCLMAWWSSRAPGTAPIVRRDWRRLVWLGFIGDYLASLLDFAGLQYIQAMQLGGAAQVLTGVLLVTLRPRADETASTV